MGSAVGLTVGNADGYLVGLSVGLGLGTPVGAHDIKFVTVILTSLPNSTQ